MGPPEFPAPFVIERSRSLGFGTGPWAREKLVETWGAPTADKYIAEAKAAGWLVSPFRGVYHVPSAQDLMVVPWLPEPIRSEFLISRTLAAADVRAWCFSAWCREQGLDLQYPAFVTDLTRPSSPPKLTPAALDRRSLQAVASHRALERSTIPFLDNLLIVPVMPALLGAARVRFTLVPEGAQAESRRQMVTALGQAALGLAGIIAMALDKDPSVAVTEMERLEQRETAARGIPYSVDSPIEDEAWITALLAALGTSRIEELVSQKMRLKVGGRKEQVQRWASLLGPPQPVAAWKDTLREGPFPFLLVPPALWAEMGADQAARRYRMLSQLGG